MVGFADRIKSPDVKSLVGSTHQTCTTSKGANVCIVTEIGIWTTILCLGGMMEDIFDMMKCYTCVNLGYELGLMKHP